MIDNTFTNKSIGQIYLADNLDVLRSLPSTSVDLIYIDPPFNTGRIQSRTQLAASQDDAGDGVGFQGKPYSTVEIGTMTFADQYDDYLGFLNPRLEEACRELAHNGSFYFHIDYREVHYAKMLLDVIFGRECFMNEIIWAYDYGANPIIRYIVGQF